jgi:gluconolactonase
MNSAASALVFLITSFVAVCPAAPEPSHFVVKNEADFARCVSPGAKVQKLAGDMMFTEGPVWHPDGFLIFSDIPANELKKWSPGSKVTTYRNPSGNANGNTIRKELLYTAEHSGRRVSMTDAGGTVTTVVDRHDGKKLNSPNDVVVKSDGTIWFTDPPYGLPKGEVAEQGGNYVFRFDPKTQQSRVLVKDFDRPNGLAFSPDEKRLYVADSGKPRHIRVFDVREDGTLGEGKVFCTIDRGGPDGIRCDNEGRVWSSAGDGVHIFAADGSLVAKILIPEAPANLCFGGPDGRVLFITARKSLYSIPVLVTGPTGR